MMQRPARKKRGKATITELKHELVDLFSSQKFAVLSTSDHGQPYNNLVAFLASDDLLSLFFFTPRSTRKYANLEADPRVSLLVDNRENMESDIRRAMAVTALGKAREVDAGKAWQDLFIEKHPQLEEFARAPTSALVQVSVEQYYVVRRFQSVMVLDMR